MKKILLYIVPILLICTACFLSVSYYLPKKLTLDILQLKEEKKYRIAIATNSSKYRAFKNLEAIKVLKELSFEFDFELIQVESGENLEWIYYIGEIHEESPIDLLIGVGWEASEVFPIIYSKYEDLHYLVLDNKIDFPYIKSIYFSRYDCSYIIGAMMAVAFPEENIFGFISNFDTSYTNVYLEGFIDGIHSIRQDVQVLADYTKSYDNETLAFELAKEQNELGIKFIMSILSPKANSGIYQYAKYSENTENPLYTTCIGIDETAEDKPFILTGITENIELALRLAVSDFLYNGYSLNTLSLGITENGVDVLLGSTKNIHYRNHDIMTDKVLAAGQVALQTINKKNAYKQRNSDNLHNTLFTAK